MKLLVQISNWLGATWHALNRIYWDNFICRFKWMHRCALLLKYHPSVIAPLFFSAKFRITILFRSDGGQFPISIHKEMFVSRDLCQPIRTNFTEHLQSNKLSRNEITGSILNWNTCTMPCFNTITKWRDALHQLDHRTAITWQMLANHRAATTAITQSQGWNQNRVISLTTNKRFQDRGAVWSEALGHRTGTFTLR